MIIPKKLKKGDTIGIIAPASPTEEKNIRHSKITLQKMGFKVKIGESCYSRYGYLSGTDKIRARDLTNMFKDKEVDAIICLRGGYGSIRILPLIDYEIIRDNPKIFVGYSDITCLHISINQKSNLITFHGPMASSDMTKELDDFTKKSFLDSLELKNINREIINPYKEKIEFINSGRCSGKLIGGNMATICSLMGTDYEINTKDKILFLEDIGESTYKIDRMFNQLKLANKLKECRGIILGNFKNCEHVGNEFSYEEVVKNNLKDFHKPIIKNLKAGHCMPMLTLLLGSNIIIDCDKGQFMAHLDD